MWKRAISAAVLCCAACAPASRQSVALDPKMRGMWALDTARSQFGGPYPAPKSGLVNWTEHGWVFALGTADGSVYADGAVIDQGCILVGVPSPHTCEVQVVTPTHVHLIMRDGARIDREGDIELVDDNTQRTVHRVTPSTGAPYTETTIWTRRPS